MPLLGGGLGLGEGALLLFGGVLDRERTYLCLGPLSLSLLLSLSLSLPLPLLLLPVLTERLLFFLLGSLCPPLGRFLRGGGLGLGDLCCFLPRFTGGAGGLSPLTLFLLDEPRAGGDAPPLATTFFDFRPRSGLELGARR